MTEESSQPGVSIPEVQVPEVQVPGAQVPDAARQIHQGHDLETGLLMRVRSWTDVMGWLRLTRVLRLSASPSLIGIVAIAYTVWRVPMLWGQWLPITSQGGRLTNLPTDLLVVSSMINPGSWWLVSAKEISGAWLFFTGWSLLVWVPVILLLARQGALLSADRTMESLSSVSQRSLKRSPQAWIAAITPTVCAAAGGVGILVCGWMMNAAWLIAPLSILITIIAIPVGVLLLGSCFAVPLGIAAIANESDPDPLDSLSRGFESFYRRPLHLAGYLIVAMACVVIVWCIATGVAFAAVAAIQAALSLAGTEPSVRDGVCGLIAHLPIVVTITTMWGMLGGVYLLSRESTGGQQVEDLWQPQVEAEDPLPRPASLG